MPAEGPSLSPAATPSPSWRKERSLILHWADADPSAASTFDTASVNAGARDSRCRIYDGESPAFLAP
eukprot:3538-Eustigmatos_ZCMA.PRE.1